MLFDWKDLQKINQIRLQLREKRRGEEAPPSLYKRNRLQFVQLLKRLKLRKLKVLIKYGLPQKNGHIQIPLSYRNFEGRKSPGELRVLEGLKLDRSYTAASLKRMLVKRRKGARIGGEKSSRRVLKPKKPLKVGEGDLGFGPSQNGLVEVDVDLSARKGVSGWPQFTRSRSSSPEIVERSLSSTFGSLLSKKPGFRFCHNLDDDTIEVLSLAPQEDKDHNSPPEFSSVYEIQAYVDDHRTRVMFEAQKIDRGIRDISGGEPSISGENLIAQISSMMSSFKELKAIAEFEEARALELAESTRKKSKVFAEQIEQIQKEIKSLEAQSNF